MGRVDGIPGLVKGKDDDMLEVCGGEEIALDGEDIVMISKQPICDGGVFSGEVKVFVEQAIALRGACWFGGRHVVKNVGRQR